MQIVILYAATVVFFLVVDAFMLKNVMQPMFEKHLGDWLADPVRFGPAVVFYLGFIAGLLYLVSIPALRADDPAKALIGGVVLGLVAYGTYEFTNYATLSRWTMQQVIADTIWGGVLTGASAWVGVMVARAFA